MKITIIDGQGGKIGKALIEKLKEKTQNIDNIKIYAIGTNAIATASMIKAGADFAATGENPCIVASKNSDIIVGPVGIAIADSLLGEVTEKIANAVSESTAKRILIPINKCNTFICTPILNISEYIDIAVEKVLEIIYS